MKRTILLHLDHAPNYREKFLRELSKHYRLIVIAHNCKKDKLTAPQKRLGYEYHELNYVGKRIRFTKGFSRFYNKYDPDIICFALNLRYPIRLLSFIMNSKLHYKWVWWGQVFGKNDNLLFNSLKSKFISAASGTLVYTKKIKERLEDNNVESFNNSQFLRTDFSKSKQTYAEHLKCLFVGRPQERKNLELLFNLAIERKDLKFRLVGPGMEKYFRKRAKVDNFEIFPAAYGEELKKHFEWSNLVVNPGHVGLLVMNAATHCRPIVVNNNVNHAPEIVLAEEANQFLIDFDDMQVVNNFFDMVISDKKLLDKKGKKLFKIAMKKYTVENMVNSHVNMFDTIIERNLKLCL